MRIVGNEIESQNPEETTLLGKQIGALLQPGDCIALRGELGAGKTALSKAIGLGLQVQEDIVSPTFNLLLSYPGRLWLHHLDAYFDGRAKSLLQESSSETFSSESVSVVEWAEKVEAYLPADRIQIEMEIMDEQLRKLRFSATGTKSKERIRQIFEKVSAK